MTSARQDAPIRLGISGLGLVGAMMIRAARVHPRFALVAGADPLPRPRAAFARDFGAAVYDDFRALCEDDTVEAVYIASPHEHHADQAVAAFAHGKHVLVEKPLALTLADCDKVIAAADKARTHLVVGHTHAFDPGYRAMADLVRGGAFGRLAMILAFNYTDFLYRPRRPEELDTARGGGITFNQVSHQIEIARLIGGGNVRSVRANAGILDPARPSEGHCAAFLEFDNGATATLIYSSYDFFDSDELHGWVAEGGGPKPPDSTHGAMRRRLAAGAVREPELQKDLGYGGRQLPTEQPNLPHFGTVIVTCERGDVRLSGNDLLVYGIDGLRKMPIARGTGRPGHGDALDALWAAVREDKRSPHTARWGKATLEVALAILQSARERHEIALQHQVGI